MGRVGGAAASGRGNGSINRRMVQSSQDAALITGVDDFEGKQVHIIQIGLGTNATFIQNMSEWYDAGDLGLDWLMHCMTCKDGVHVKGVAVEAMPDHVAGLKPLIAGMPGVSLVQCAIGDADGDRDLYAVSKQTYDDLLEGVSWWQRRGLERDLSYVLNMSCVDCWHPYMEHCVQRIVETYNVKVVLQPIRVCVWSWGKFAQRLNFGGCELLVVDTEGFDVRILRSMIAHCSYCERSNGTDVWPYVIQFETQGHADALAGDKAEWHIINELVDCGYTLVHYSYYNSHLVRSMKLKDGEQINGWARTFVCSLCGIRDLYPYVTASEDWKVYCHFCIYSWSRGYGVRVDIGNGTRTWT